MRTLGKWAILTHDELEKIKDLAYQRGLRSKWKAKKRLGEIEELLDSVGEAVTISPREAA